MRTISHDPIHLDELDCARRIVRELFRRTGLTQIVAATPHVIVGTGNWISFTVPAALPLVEILSLRSRSRKAFVRDIWRPAAGARSRTTPSLHLISIGLGQTIKGHVDAYYWTAHPFRHACEFITKETRAPSAIWRQMSVAIERARTANAVFSG